MFRYWRFGFFFVGGALCVGIVVPYNSPALINALSTQGGSTGASSPYIIAMQNLGINGLPHLVNALILTSIFSAGNSYTYMASRSLYSLALSGQAPRFLRKTGRNGVPYYCFAVTMIFPFLSFLQVGSGSAQAITWLVNLVTASQLLNYVFIGITYLFFYRAVKAQGIDRRSLPYRGTFSSIPFMPVTNGAIQLLICSLVRLVPTVRQLLRPVLRHHRRLPAGLLGLPSWKLGRRHLLHLLHHDLRVHRALHRLEGRQAHEIHPRKDGRPRLGQACHRRIRGGH